VRDLVLGRPVVDLDLVTEGDAIALARAIARERGGATREHPRFGTATLETPAAGRFDVATSRAEVYDSPAALPRVSPAGIVEDLSRRDFGVNALALRIAPAPLRILDPHGGLEDLALRRIRMLHPRSPFDDPTRAFRAVRYANRLGFRIDPETRRAIRAAVASGAFSRVSGDRIRRELVLLFSEPGRARAIAELGRLGVVGAAIHPSLSTDASARERLRRLERVAAARGGAGWLPYLLAWAAGLDRGEEEAVASRLNLPRRESRMLRSWPETFRRAPKPGGEGRRLEPEERLALEAVRGSAPGEPTRLAIRGRDLVEAGVPPGPAVGRALAAARTARESGAISEEEELAFALGIARERDA